jgi:putative FmdB family regulatory protein
MPLYEYLCDQCGHRFERIRKFSDPTLRKCPECGGKIEQLISTSAVQFKGSGWYVTDYGRKPSSGAQSSKSDSDRKSDSDGKSESGKDSGSPKNPPKTDASSKKADKK